MSGYVRNYRSHLIEGLRARIERECFGRRLLMLWSYLLDAGELDD